MTSNASPHTIWTAVACHEFSSTAGSSIKISYQYITVWTFSWSRSLIISASSSVPTWYISNLTAHANISQWENRLTRAAQAFQCSLKEMYNICSSGKPWVGNCVSWTCMMWKAISCSFQLCIKYIKLLMPYLWIIPMDAVLQKGY